MMETQKLILYVALGLVLMLLWQSWLEYSAPTVPVGQQQSQTGSSPSTPAIDDGSVPDAPVTQATQASALPSAPGVESAEEGIPESDTITVDTDLLRVSISIIGADIKRVRLKKYPVTVDDRDNYLDLMSQTQPDVFVGESGLLGRDHDFPNHKTAYQVTKSEYSLSEGDSTLEVVFNWLAEDGIEYSKQYTFHRDSYEIDIAFKVNNLSNLDWTGYQYSQFARTQVSDDSSLGFLGRLPSYKGGAIFTPEEHYEKYDFSDMQDGNLKRRTETGWVAMLQHYFVGAWLPEDPGPYELYSSVANATTAPLYRIGYKTLTPVNIGVGQIGEVKNRLFIGPKEQNRLDLTGAEGLKLTVDYGWLTIIASPLFWLLNEINNIVANWGWAIIFLTMIIKLVFFPLSAASYKSMAKMKNLQPRLKTLKERYGDDRQKFQQAMMEIYKKEKINPLGGCLPILVQIPVFIALYWTLLESVELRQANWFWLADLSVKDPYYILPVLMGISMFVQQKLNPAPMDDLQQKIMMALPFVFTIFFLFFPSGLVLYWVVNNVLSIAQQWFIINKLQASST
ncbi:MAG: YidC/Oxa1 family membrane protein insertase [Parasphingorhabdus sp.]|jgi:YidC/Oxa1 family membrane protein insertase